MTIRRALTVLLASATLLGAVAPAAQAQRPFFMAERGGGISIGEAAERVRERTGGQVLAADVMTDGSGRMVYLIRVLVRPGQVRTFRVDAETGRIQ